jgi:hypothetical protein
MDKTFWKVSEGSNREELQVYIAISQDSTCSFD